MTVFALATGAGMYWFTHWMTVQLLDWHLKRDKRLHELYALLPSIRALLKAWQAQKEEANGRGQSTP